MREGSFRRNPVVQQLIIILFLLQSSVNQLHAWTNGSYRKTNHMVLLYTGTTGASTGRQKSLLQLNEAISGSFFNPVPESNENNTGSDNDDDDMSIPKPSKAIQPSTINGIPSEQVGLDLGMTLQAARQNDPITRKPYVGIGPSSLNDVTKPEYDDQGYTLYVDERTGTKARVFEALVTYPCLFTLKIVGANDDTFVQDVLQIVANTCQVETETNTNTNIIEHSIKYNGKWASITVQAPVQSAQMLYQLYENVDQDPRVKFKF